MSGVNLYDYQLDAVNRMKNGCILCGGVGSGKSRTGLAYYYIQNGGRVNTKRYVKMHDSPQDLYIITTARKRDTLEWEEEMIPFMMTTDESARMYKHKVVVDSWNNVHKYVGAKDAFFIFDEQRVVGDGQWVKSFLKITKENDWILLSATPGDCWTDYIPVFVANGFYKNRTQFKNEHIVYSRFSKFPKIDRYINTTRLVRLRDRILVDMDFKRPTIQHHETVYVDFDKKQYKDICKTRWNPWKNKPIETASEYCTLLRKVINTDPSRQQEVLDICKARPRVIIFYNFDYELDKFYKQAWNDVPYLYESDIKIAMCPRCRKKTAHFTMVKAEDKKKSHQLLCPNCEATIIKENGQICDGVAWRVGVPNEKVELRCSYCNQSVIISIKDIVDERIKGKTDE